MRMAGARKILDEPRTSRCQRIRKCSKKKERKKEGFPGGAVVENLPANAGDTGLSPGLGISHMPQSK